MNLPNRLTLARVLLIPVIVLLMISGNAVLGLIGLLCFMIAAATDFVDGHLARKNNQVTDFGKFMDPIADKLLVTAVMVLMVEQSTMPGWMLIIFVAREFIISGMRLVAANKGTVLAAGPLGKAKTVSQMVSIIWIVGAYFIAGLAGAATPEWVAVTGNVLLYAALIFSVWSGTDYMIRNRKVFTDFSM